MNLYQKQFFDKNRAFFKQLVTFLLLLIAIKANCQVSGNTSSILVTSYGIEEGLRQSMVSQVCQDNLGLIWMVTGDGLHYFDGQEFGTFRLPPDKQNNYSDNVMRSVAEAGPGRLVLTSTSAIFTFNTESGQFKTVYRKDGNCPVVFNLSIDNKPLAWLIGEGFCLVSNIKTDRLKLIFKKGQGAPADFVPLEVVQISDDEIFICGETGIIVMKLTDRFSDLVFEADWIPITDCQDITKTVKGEILVLVGSKLFLLEKNRTMSLYNDTKLKGKFNLFADSRDNIWLTDKFSKNIYRISGDELKEIKPHTRVGKFTEILSPAVISIFEDRENNLWFGTDGNGVLLYSPGQVQFQKSNIGFTRCVTAFNNKIWAGTFNNGLWELSHDLGEARRVNPSEFNNPTYFLDMIDDHKGRLWIATRNELVILDKNGNTVRKFPYKCLHAKFINQQRDTIMLCYDNKLLRFSAYSTPELIGSQLFVSVRAFLDVENYYWIGNQFGIYRYKKEIGFDINKAFSQKNRISANPVYGLTVHNGFIWAATGNGIACYNSNGTEHTLDKSFSSLKNDVIYSAIPDDQGRLWFTGNNGIGCIFENRIIFFNAKNNLQSLEFNHNAALRTENGNLYFGGINGLNHINPSIFDPDKEAPLVKLISLFVSDTAYTSCIPPPNPQFNLSRLAPHISGKVFTSDYPNAEVMLYSFFLEGYQPDYSKPSRNSAFTYRNLPPGSYRLFVKSAGPYMNWSEPECILSFTIKPPFYATWWFMALLTLFIIGITVLIVKGIQKVRYKEQIKEIERQIAIEKERLRISKDMHDEVGASLTRISILSELAKKQQNEPARTQQIVDQISEISSNVVDEMSEIIWAMNPRNDTLDCFSSYVRQYASTYLESAGIDGKFLFPDEIPPRPMSSELRRNLFLVIKEALHNVVKHSGAATVNLLLLFDHNTLTIEINDNGQGFLPGEKTGTGNGLINMHKRMEDIDGQFEIRSETGKGSEIKLSVCLRLKADSH